MIGFITIGLACIIAKKIDDLCDYKEPKDEHKDRYK